MKRSEFRISLLMLLVFAGSLAGIALDDRMITGAPAWLKPSKFAPIGFSILPRIDSVGIE